MTGFAIHLTASRALPGTRIGRVDRLGRNLHEEIADDLGVVLTEAARRIPRLLRLDARIFDEDPVRRQKLRDSLRTAGWSPSEGRRQYSHTLMLQLAESQAEVLKRFSLRVRATITKALGSPLLRFGPVVGNQYADRIRYLLRLTFERTGSVPPPFDVKGILRDSARGDSSLLIGAFARAGEAPQDLVALAWARLHGDHAVLEINASERSQLFRNHLSPGFGLVSHLIAWGIPHGAQWLDLGGLSSMRPSADDPMRGIVEFKTRFSSDFREVAEEWRFEPSPLLATAASTVRSVRDSARGWLALKA
ncbi:MAG: Methicillin resistance protein [Gammaproteobacteria bacterium]|nr:Methicillin resistance protein [Gammaproteobacteria bacterium]